MATIPYPPAPELGWYADDPVDKPAAVSSAAAEPSPVSSSTASHAAKGSSDGDIEDWDSTVLSSSFTAKVPRKIYILHNDATGQTIVIDKSTLLGRKPSMDVPEGAKAEKVEDPTRTTSRNHAAISIDQNGARCGSRTTVPSTAPTSSATGRKRRCSRASRANSTPPPRCVSETSSSNSPSASSGIALSIM